MENKYYDYNLVIKVRTTEPIKVRKNLDASWAVYTEEQQQALIKVVNTFIENREFFIVNGVYLEKGYPTDWKTQFE